MQIVYDKFFELLKIKGITQKQIREDLKLAGTILQRLRHNESVTMETIGTLCEYLRCQPSDIVEIIYSDVDFEAMQKQRQIEALQKQLAELQNS